MTGFELNQTRREQGMEMDNMYREKEKEFTNRCEISGTLTFLSLSTSCMYVTLFVHVLLRFT